MKKTIIPIKVVKAVSQYGKWVFKPLKSTVVICACGNKYIVTRPKQIECVNCTYSKIAR